MAKNKLLEELKAAAPRGKIRWIDNVAEADGDLARDIGGLVDAWHAEDTEVRSKLRTFASLSEFLRNASAAAGVPAGRYAVETFIKERA